jgi:hypothetical protein
MINWSWVYDPHEDTILGRDNGFVNLNIFESLDDRAWWFGTYVERSCRDVIEVLFWHLLNKPKNTAKSLCQVCPCPCRGLNQASLEYEPKSLTLWYIAYLFACEPLHFSDCVLGLRFWYQYLSRFYCTLLDC